MARPAPFRPGWSRRRILAAALLASAAAAFPLTADTLVTGAQKVFAFPANQFGATVDVTMLGFDDGDADGLGDDGDASLVVQPDSGPLPFTLVTTERVGLGYDIDPDAQLALGEATVTGAGAVWDVQGPLLGIGLGGAGAVQVLDGGALLADVQLGGWQENFSGFGALSVDVGPGEGTLIVSGPGSSFTGSLRFHDGLAASGQASLSIEDGASADLASLVLHGPGPGSPVQGVITGAGTLVHADSLVQRGTLRVELAAQLTADSADLSFGNTTVTGSASLFQVANALVLDQGDPADPEVLTVADGGVVESQGGLLDPLVDTTRARVSGVGSRWDAGSALQLDAGATLIAEDGAEVLAGSLSGAGVVRVASGALVDTDDAQLSLPPFLLTGAIELDGGHFHTGELRIGSGAALRGAGDVTGDVRLLNSDALNPKPVLAPGDPTGLLSIAGALELSDARVEIELAGTAPADFDRLAVSGAVDTPTTVGASTVVFTPIAGFLPQPGDSFPFLAATGGYTEPVGLVYDFSALPGEWSYQVQTSAGTQTLEVLPEPADGLWLALWAPFALRRLRRRANGVPASPRA